MDSKVKKDLERILDDNSSGSTELLIRLNNLIKKYPQNSDTVKTIISYSEKIFSDFEVINDYLHKIKRDIDDEEKLKNHFNFFEEKYKNLFKSIYKNAKPYFKDVNTILTLSNSKTLLEFLKIHHNQNRKLKVIVCESRPAMEGRILAKALLKENINVEIIPEALISLFIKKVDAALIGADTVLKNKNVINKTGSNNLAIVCKYYNRPFYVVASTDKYSNRKKHNVSQKDPDEVWKFKQKKLQVHNIYFEEIDKKLITRIFTE